MTTTKSLITILLLAATLSSCTVGKQLTKTGFNRSLVFTMQGYLWSVDPKITYRQSMNGALVIYSTDDPKIQGILEAYKMINQHSAELANK